MNRKKFLGTTLPLLAASQLGAWAGVTGNSSHPYTAAQIPPRLRKGDTIGITSPAGYLTLADAEPAIRQIEAWGFKVEPGKTLGKRDFTFGGTDDERLADLQELLDNRKIKAILCARGGYGVVRILDKLRFEKFRQHPKWIIGFSDITALHCHIHQNCGTATLHAKMCNSFPADMSQASPEQLAGIDSIRQCLSGEAMTYEVPAHPANRKGKAEGLLIGGNLSIIETLSGSRSDINTEGKILFLEDTGEYLYHIDRMFWNLERSGKLKKLAGLIIGGFNIKKEEDADDRFGLDLLRIVNEKVSRHPYPVCFDFPVGHQKNNMALACGIRHQLIVGDQGSWLHSKK